MGAELMLLDYQIRTDTFTMPGDADTTVLTCDPIAFDGSTRIQLELHWEQLAFNGMNVRVYDNGDDLGALQVCGSGSVISLVASVHGAAFLTPDADTHTYSFVAHVVGPDAASSNIDTGCAIWSRITTAPVADDLSFASRVTDFSGSNPWLQADPISFDGSTRVRIDVFGSEAHVGPATFDLLDNGVTLGSLGKFAEDVGEITVPFFASRFVTPDAGDHTFSVESDASAIYAAPANFPAWLRVTNA